MVRLDQNADWSLEPRTAWDTCFHRAESMELTLEAEQVAIFFDTKQNRYHLSVAYEGWFSCSTLGADYYKSLSKPELLILIQEKLSFLKLVHG